MKKIILILITIISLFLLCSCSSKEIQVSNAQSQDLENSKNENLSRVKQSEDNINQKYKINKEDITFDDQKQVEQLINEYFAYLEKKDYSSAWELISSEQKKLGSKENFITRHYGLESIKLISMKGYIPPKKIGTGESTTWEPAANAPPNTPTVYFEVIIDADPEQGSPSVWNKGLNERFVNTVKDSDGKWRISGLSTGL